MPWKSIAANWKTTLGGALAAIPAMVSAAGFTLSTDHQHWISLCGGVGALLLGLAAKDATNHSTWKEVNLATADEVKKTEPK